MGGLWHCFTHINAIVSLKYQRHFFVKFIFRLWDAQSDGIPSSPSIVIIWKRIELNQPSVRRLYPCHIYIYIYIHIHIYIYIYIHIYTYIYTYIWKVQFEMGLVMMMMMMMMLMMIMICKMFERKKMEKGDRSKPVVTMIWPYLMAWTSICWWFAKETPPIWLDDPPVKTSMTSAGMFHSCYWFANGIDYMCSEYLKHRDIFHRN